MKRLLLLFLLLPLCLAGQEAWCPQPTNRLVNDYAQILTAAQRQQLEQRLVAFNDTTSNQLLIIITPTLQGQEIMDLATRIGTTWQVGQKQLNNGVVILIKSKTLEENWGDVAIAPGYGLEGALPDLFCKRIIDDKMIEPLSEGDYYGALTAALDVIEPVCAGEYSYAQYEKDDTIETCIALGVLALLIVAGFLGYRWLLKYRKNHPNDGDGLGGSGTGGGFWGGPTYTSGWGGSSGSSGGFGGFGGGSFGGGGAHGRF